MRNLDTNLKHYYRSIRQHLPCSRKLKVRIISEIESNILAYLEENPNADFAAIEARFGAPNRIASAYVDELGAPELLKKLQIRRRILTVVIGAVAFCLLLWVTVVIWGIVKEINFSNGTLIPSDIVEIGP